MEVGGQCRSLNGQGQQIMQSMDRNLLHFLAQVQLGDVHELDEEVAVLQQEELPQRLEVSLQRESFHQQLQEQLGGELVS